MTTDADRAREIAETVFPLGGFGCDGAHSRLYNRIASALTASRKAPEGCVIDDKGTVREYVSCGTMTFKEGLFEALLVPTAAEAAKGV